MQNLHALVGARGWTWRVEQVETFSRRAGPAFVHLSGRRRAGARLLVAVRPFEPVAQLAARDHVRPVPVRDALAIVATSVHGAHRAFSIRAAERLRGDIHPWQLAAALAFERGYARVLNADDTGMGKTVSAGLAIAQCLDGLADRRCLVLAPGHLLRQWREELAMRLAIDARIIDATAVVRLRREIPAGVSPWSLPGCSIASIDFAKQQHVARSMHDAIWDLLVIDEAHLVCGDSERHAAADIAARQARRVLLLTATPSDGGGERMQTLVSLGGAGDRLIQLRHVAEGRAQVERRLWIRPSRATRDLHASLAAYTQWIASGPRLESPAIALLCSLLSKRALSSPHAVHISLGRRLALLGRDPLPVQPSLFDAADDPGVLGARSGFPVERERRRLEALIATAAEAARSDRRLQALARLVSRTREPVVIFTCFRDTALLMAKSLAPHAAVRLVHGELPQGTADAALEAFISGSARVLVATDVAAQGLNLHRRCRWVVQYDLPWRPPTLRQRLGRVDRLGQTRRAHATFLLDRTALAAASLNRIVALTRKMHTQERVSDQRWDVLAAAEARRLTRDETGRMPRAATRTPAEITVLESEFVDASGLTVERVASILAGGEAIARAWAEEQNVRRHAQLQRLTSRRSRLRIQREHAVLAAAATAPASINQDGLFDRRGERMRQSDTARRARLARATREAIQRHALEGAVSPAHVRTVATFERGTE